LKALLWSMLPLLLYGCFRRYLQGMNLVKPVMFALVTANLVNVAGNWVLIYGHLGAPAMGVVGSAWATGAARVYMAAVLAGYALWHARRHGTGLLDAPLGLDPARLRRLLGLGVPAALQMTLEAGAFAAATALAGRLVPAALAAHQIALVVASCTFMVPLGIASAGAVRVGQALGRRDPEGAARAGWTAIALGAGFMALAAVSFVVAPRPILRIFTDDPAVIHAGVGLLFVASLFQLFDGLQVVATGTLRGAAETRTPMICNLVAYYVVGLPLGYALCFSAGWGIIGLWTGLSVGLIGCGIVLLRVWAAKVRSFEIVPASATGTLARLRPDLGG
jgi:MATE family multidrug resistance protein